VLLIIKTSFYLVYVCICMTVDYIFHQFLFQYQILLPAPSKTPSSSSGLSSATTNGPMGASPGGSSGVLSPTNSGGSRAQTPIRLTFSAASSQLGQAAASLSISRNSPLGCPPTPHEVAFAQKMLSRIDDMKGKNGILLPKLF
jgi:hypothetical protein